MTEAARAEIRAKFADSDDEEVGLDTIMEHGDDTTFLRVTDKAGLEAAREARLRRDLRVAANLRREAKKKLKAAAAAVQATKRISRAAMT